ncbi:MAG: radical SAM protein [Lachnospiraceae bacterium]|nr:radical SAM protein [Lachnospiraceae bacterium]
MKKILMEDTCALASNWVLYWYDDQALLCDENDEFAYIELDDTELDVLSAVNSLHKMKDVWDYLRNEYGMSECDEGLDVLKDYLDQLLNKGIISEGTKTKPIYGEKGKKYPLYISVELTNRCNFKCSHCYKEAGSDNWDYIDENRIIPFLKEMINKIHGVTLTGGEATLHPAFSDIVQELPQNSIALLTNGSYLNKISDETLLRLGHIQISLYGCDEEEYV